MSRGLDLHQRPPGYAYLLRFSSPEHIKFYVLRFVVWTIPYRQKRPRHLVSTHLFNTIKVLNFSSGLSGRKMQLKTSPNLTSNLLNNYLLRRPNILLLSQAS